MVALPNTWKHTVFRSVSISEPGWKRLECKVCLLTLFPNPASVIVHLCIVFLHRFLIVSTWTHVCCLCATPNWFPTYPPAKSWLWSAVDLTNRWRRHWRCHYVSPLCIFQGPAVYWIMLSYSPTHTHRHTQSHMGTKGYNFPCCLF